MTQVLFGQSYFLRFDPKLWQAMQPYAPLGTLYAASYLRQFGYSVALFDAMLAVSEEEWSAALEKHQPEFAVIFEDNFNYLSKMCLLRMRQAAFKMITAAKRHGCRVILCGADATDHAEKYLLQGGDFILIGEGEVTLVELLHQLTGRSRKRFDEIPGLVYRSAEGQIVRNARRPDIRDLDSLPFPAWDLVDVPRYREIWRRRHGFFSMNMVTTRGCPFHCNWCAKPIWGQRYNSRSPENVAAEMTWLKETYQPDHIWFADDIFGLKPGWLRRFGELVGRDGVHIPFKCLSRADLLTRPGEVDALRIAGAHTVWLGAESGSQAILDAMDKGTRIDQIRESARLLKSAGIRACFFLQFGYPGETWEEIQETMRLVWDEDPDDIGISISYPMPGTRFFENVREELGEQQNWLDSSDLAMLYHGSYTTRFYRLLHRRVHSEFRLRKAWRSLGKKMDLRTALRVVYHLVQLPLLNFRLRNAGREQRPLVHLPHLPHAQAAQPTPQEHP